MQGLRNYTAYVACDSTEQLVGGVVALCEKEGMRRVEEGQGKLRTAPALECNNWRISVFQGAPGWHVLSTQPWDLLSDRARGSGSTRLFELCESLRAAGFALHISDGTPWGRILLEADGHGRQHISGLWHDSGHPSAGYLGTPVDGEMAEPRFALLDSLQTLLEDGRDFTKCGLRADDDSERACEHIARQLGGAACGDSWTQWNVRPGFSHVLHFTWPAQDRPEPPPSAHELAMQEFNSAPRYFYADGSAISKDDAVLFDGGRFPGLVTGFLTGHFDGKPYPSAVLVSNGEPGSRAVGLESPKAGGQFASLQFVEYNTVDFVRAGINWLETKAGAGDAVAQFNLGNLYATGSNVAQDFDRAVAWWRKAAEQGSALAQYWLGSMYHHGRGVQLDHEQALGWWRKAGEQGHRDAQFNLGFLFERGLGVARHQGQAVFWFQKAAVQGHATAQYALGFCYERGVGVTRDDSLAASWYAKAAEQGEPHAQCNLADKYEHGRGVQQDYALALKWYQKSAAKGVAEAMYSLGGMYERGLGVAVDRESAVQWWRKAAELGSGAARRRLEGMGGGAGR